MKMKHILSFIWCITSITITIITITISTTISTISSSTSGCGGIMLFLSRFMQYSICFIFTYLSTIITIIIFTITMGICICISINISIAIWGMFVISLSRWCIDISIIIITIEILSWSAIFCSRSSWGGSSRLFVFIWCDVANIQPMHDRHTRRIFLWFIALITPITTTTISIIISSISSISSSISVFIDMSNFL